MITFLQPLALLALLAAAIPPLLHLIERRTPPSVPFPAVRYLAETTREQHRRLKLRNLLLLLLRTGLIALLALAAARPVVPWSIGSAHAPTAIAIVLDNSLSAGAVVDGRPVLDALRARARDVLAALSASDHVWLVLADGTPRRATAEETRRALDDVRVSAERLDVAQAARTAAGLVRADPLPNHVVLILSDLQRTALSPGAAPAVPVVAWGPPAESGNHAIDSAWSDPPLFRPNGNVVVATGGGDEPLAVRLELDDHEVARALAHPGESAVLQPPPARRPGWAVGHVLLDADELKADDDWWVALHTVQPAAVKAGAGAGRFVSDGLSVLAQAGRVRAGDDVTIDATAPAHGAAIVLPSADPAMLGALNRALAARGVAWRYGALREGEWQVVGLAAPRFAVRRRYQLAPSGTGGVVLATVAGTGQPWMVRDRGVIVVASRLEPEWTALPLDAGFIPTLDLLVNRLAAGDAGVVHATPGQTVTLPDAARSVLLPAGAQAVGSDRRVTAPLEPGAYFLRGAAGDTVGALVVNHDPRESVLQRATPGEARAAFGDALTLPGVDDVARAALKGERRADLAGPLLGLALVLAVVELGLASTGGRRA